MLIAKAGLVIAGGLLLGALLGDMADPKMKAPPEPSWRVAMPDYGAMYASTEVGPEPIPFGGFPPEPDAVAAAWPSPERWDAEPYEYEPFPMQEAGVGDHAFADYEPFPAASDAEHAGDEAEQAATDAALAASRALPPASLAPGEACTACGSEGQPAAGFRPPRPVAY